MKELLILRHAKSSWAGGTLSDHERPLQARGERDAPRIGRLLQEEGLLPDLIITSTARRARETASLAAAAVGYEGEVEETGSFYHASPSAYLARLRTLPADVKRVLVIGHNPGMEELIEMLTGAEERFPTAALARVALPITSWEKLRGHTKGELLNLWRPKEIE